jgi:thymidylate synthase (FAD)
MEKGFTIPCLDHGFVRYIDHMGTDQRIVEAARISYKSPSKGDEGDKKLLHYLWKHKHTSPFEQCSITFNVKMPIFVMREWVRHRTAKLNEVSGRYVELPNEFYIPDKWRQQDTKNKQGSITVENFNPATELDEGHGEFGECLWSSFETASEALREHCRRAYELYLSLLRKGVAREMARMVLPVNLYTEIYWTIDLHNLLHFLTLRTSDLAQYEIRVFANAVKRIAAELYPWTLEAFDNFKWTIQSA